MEDNDACDMIGDPIEKSTINKFFEVQVGDSVYIHFSIGVVLKIHISESAVINEIRETENYSNHTLLGNRLTKSFYITPCP